MAIRRLAIIPGPWIPPASERSGSWSRSASPSCSPSRWSTPRSAPRPRRRSPRSCSAPRRASTYELTGRVVKGSVRHEGEGLRFRVADRDDAGQSIPVTYTGTIPDPFRGGREIVLTGTVERGVFVGERDTLVTKCPSKFTTSRSDE